MSQNQNPELKLKIPHLNAIDKKELMKRVEILASRKSCRLFSKKEIELLLLSHWNRIKKNQENLNEFGFNALSHKKPKNPLLPLQFDQELSHTEKVHWWNRGLNRIEFYDFLHKVFGLTDKDLLPQIFAQFDTNKSGQIEDLEWVECLAILLRGTLDDKIQYAFSVYDTNGDGYIARDEMQGMLKMCIARPGNEDDVDEAVKDIVEIVLKLMDKDHDFKVGKVDFRMSVQDEPLLLEAFGPVLPEEDLIEAFQNDVFAEVIESRRYTDRAIKEKRKIRFCSRKDSATASESPSMNAGRQTTSRPTAHAQRATTHAPRPTAHSPRKTIR